jgi:hypothetical protein
VATCQWPKSPYIRLQFQLGTEFAALEVMIMVPAALVAMLLAGMAGVAHADHFWSIVTTMILAGTSVQIGYLAGLLIRAGITPMRRH